VIVVLDSSAMIAWLAAEPEGAMVAALFAQLEESESARTPPSPARRFRAREGVGLH